MRVPPMAHHPRPSGFRQLRPWPAALLGSAGIVLALVVLLIANHP